MQNVSVYFRPKYLKFRDRDNEELRLSCTLRSLDLPVPSLLTSEWWRTLPLSRYGNAGPSRGSGDRVTRKDAKGDAKTAILVSSNKDSPNTNITTTEE
jgi:hypothetical protein